jgi:hypothetical protein
MKLSHRARMAFQGAQEPPAFGSHTFTVRSEEPLTASVAAVWPSRERRSRPLSASHTFTV